jgi:pilus assembly protein CpaC
MMTVNGEQQVLLKVKIAEVQRNLLKEFGTDTDIAGVNSGNFGVRNTTDLAGKLTKTPFSTGSLAYQTGATGPISLTLQALEEKGLLNTLAEPNLTAISGQRAEFLAGGEYPVPVGQSLGTTTIEFRRFGVALGFTPLVLSNNKINLEMETEVSLLSNEARLELESTSVPSLSVRRAQTTVELASGGSLMIAGIIKSEATNSMSSLPGINKIPIIGQLFSSQSFKRNETELVIFVTAYLVNPIKAPDAVVADDVPVAKALPPQMPQPHRVVEPKPTTQITRVNEQPLPKNLPATVAGGYRMD